MNVFAGYSTSEYAKNSASGGVATAIGRYCMEQGFVVAGARYTDDLYDAEYDLAYSVKELYSFQGSKYFYAQKKDIYRRVSEHLSQGTNVLFIGLPCEVAGLMRYIGSQTRTNTGELLTIDLVCHGATFPEVHKHYIAYLEKKYKSKVKSINSRKIKTHWEQPYYEVAFENGKVFQKQLYDTEFGYFFSRLCREVCFDCKFKGNNSYADLTIGDYWGTQETDPSFNKDGTSVIICHTEKGQKLIHSCSDLMLFESTYEDAIHRNSNIDQCKPQSPRFRIIKENFRKYGVIQGAKASYTAQEKLRLVLKRIIPQEIVYRMKWR